MSPERANWRKADKPPFQTCPPDNSPNARRWASTVRSTRGSASPIRDPMESRRAFGFERRLGAGGGYRYLPGTRSGAGGGGSPDALGVPKESRATTARHRCAWLDPPILMDSETAGRLAVFEQCDLHVPSIVNLRPIDCPGSVLVHHVGKRPCDRLANPPRSLDGKVHAILARFGCRPARWRHGQQAP
jgi:hypothetical protein